MSSTRNDPPTRAELLWVGSGAWCACDRTVKKSDPHRIIAYLKCTSDHVDVLWVRERRSPDRYDSLRSALEAVELSTAAAA
jgi:hypothetical protein